MVENSIYFIVWVCVCVCFGIYVFCASEGGFFVRRFFFWLVFFRVFVWVVWSVVSLRFGGFSLGVCEGLGNVGIGVGFVGVFIFFLFGVVFLLGWI